MKRGFAFVEVALALAVLAIITAVGAGYMVDNYKRELARKHANALVAIDQALFTMYMQGRSYIPNFTIPVPPDGSLRFLVDTSQWASQFPSLRDVVPPSYLDPKVDITKYRLIVDNNNRQIVGIEITDRQTVELINDWLSRLLPFNGVRGWDATNKRYVGLNNGENYSASINCPPSYTFDGSRCVGEPIATSATPICLPPGTWNPNTQRCEATPQVSQGPRCKINWAGMYVRNPWSSDDYRFVYFTCTDSYNCELRLYEHLFYNDSDIYYNVYIRSASDNILTVWGFILDYRSGRESSSKASVELCYKNGTQPVFLFGAGRCEWGGLPESSYTCYSYPDVYINVSPGNATTSYSCPSGYTLSGSVCVSSATMQCPSGTIYSNGQCVQCILGTYDRSTGKCVI